MIIAYMISNFVIKKGFLKLAHGLKIKHLCSQWFSLIDATHPNKLPKYLHRRRRARILDARSKRIGGILTRVGHTRCHRESMNIFRTLKEGTTWERASGGLWKPALSPVSG
jgi:hypothetical protein